MNAKECSIIAQIWLFDQNAAKCKLRTFTEGRHGIASQLHLARGELAQYGQPPWKWRNAL